MVENKSLIQTQCPTVRLDRRRSICIDSSRTDNRSFARYARSSVQGSAQRSARSPRRSTPPKGRFAEVRFAEFAIAGRDYPWIRKRATDNTPG